MAKFVRNVNSTCWTSNILAWNLILPQMELNIRETFVRLLCTGIVFRVSRVTSIPALSCNKQRCMMSCCHGSVFLIHDDVIEWKHFPRYWPFVRGIHRSPVNSPHKGQWRGALMLSLISPCKRLSKRSWGWWFETLSRPLLRHSNDSPNKGAVMLASFDFKPDKLLTQLRISGDLRRSDALVVSF